MPNRCEPTADQAQSVALDATLSAILVQTLLRFFHLGVSSASVRSEALDATLLTATTGHNSKEPCIILYALNMQGYLNILTIPCTDRI